MSARVDEAAVRAALTTVMDPELAMSIIDLGLVYGIDVQGGGVEVTMTLTAPGCPLQNVLLEWVGAAVRAVPGVEHVAVTLTFEPPWTPARVRPGL